MWNSARLTSQLLVTMGLPFTPSCPQQSSKTSYHIDTGFLTHPKQGRESISHPHLAEEETEAGKTRENGAEASNTKCQDSHAGLTTRHSLEGVWCRGEAPWISLLVRLLSYWRESKLIFQQWRNSHAPVGPSYQDFRTQFSTGMVPPSSADILHNLYKHSLLVVTTKEGTLPAFRRQKPEMPPPILAARDSLRKQTV